MEKLDWKSFKNGWMSSLSYIHYLLDMKLPDHVKQKMSIAAVQTFEKITDEKTMIEAEEQGAPRPGVVTITSKTDDEARREIVSMFIDSAFMLGTFNGLNNRDKLGRSNAIKALGDSICESVELLLPIADVLEGGMLAGYLNYLQENASRANQDSMNLMRENNYAKNAWQDAIKMIKAKFFEINKVQKDIGRG